MTTERIERISELCAEEESALVKELREWAIVNAIDSEEEASLIALVKKSEKLAESAK